jgi:hypothetical protein
MRPVAGSRQTAKPTDFENDARRMAASLEKNKYFVLLALTIFYAAGAMAHARSKPLWYDEIFTVIAASAPDAAGTWKLAQQVDASPPLTHLLTHFAVRWFGNGEVATRLPAIAGFWIFCLCLFWFVRRRLGIFYGLAALLLPVATLAYDYSYEARAYGPELAFCGLVLVSWQAAACAANAQQRLRYAAACAALAISLTGALLCQYYAVMLWVPLAGGEGWRCWKARRIHWGIWAAMVFGAAPLVWRVATIRAVVSGFSQVAWSQPYPIDVLGFWEDGLQHSLSVLVLALAVMALWAGKSAGSPAPPPPIEPQPSLPPHEILAGLLFLTIPALVVAAGMLVTRSYAPRYALPGLTGVVLLLPAVAARLSGGRSLPAFLMAAFTSLWLIVATTAVPPPQDPMAEESMLVQALGQGPVVVADGQTFMQIWHYLPERLKSRMIFLVDREASVKYQAFNTAALDAALTGVRDVCRLPVFDYRDFAIPGKEFRIFQNPLKPGWLLEKIAADGGAETIDRYSNYRHLYRVRMPGIGASSGAPAPANPPER